MFALESDFHCQDQGDRYRNREKGGERERQRDRESETDRESEIDRKRGKRNGTEETDGRIEKVSH